jgi:hypothetical protein
MAGSSLPRYNPSMKTIATPPPPNAPWLMDYEGTRKDIERMETEAQTHENPFADHGAEPAHLTPCGTNMDGVAGAATLMPMRQPAISLPEWSSHE